VERFAVIDPYRPPSAEVADAEVQRKYGGIGRALYGGVVVLLVLVFTGFQADPVATTLIGDYVPLLVFVLLIISSGLRLSNVGSSSLWSLLLLIPILNVALVFRCVAFPEGYRHTGQLDMPAKAMVTILSVGILVLMGILVLESLHP